MRISDWSSDVCSADLDVACVLHTHTDDGLAIAAQEEGLLPISQPAALLMNRIGYHDYEGIVLRMDERERLLKNLGQNNFLVLRNHGLLTAAPDIPRAFLWMYVLEKARSEEHTSELQSLMRISYAV